MRENGVRSLSVACHLCHHQAVMNVDAFGDAVPVPSFGPRMVLAPPITDWLHERTAEAGLADPASPSSYARDAYSIPLRSLARHRGQCQIRCIQDRFSQSSLLAVPSPAAARSAGP